MIFHIQLITEDDAPAWRELRLRALREHPDAFGSNADDFVKQSVADVVARFKTSSNAGDNRLFGAFAGDGALIGNAGIIRMDGRKTAHRMAIWGVYVAPEARGTGAGTALMEAALAHARTTTGVLQVHIAVASHNQGAVRLYERLGFVRYGREPRALLLLTGPVDEDFMVLMLDGSTHPLPSAVG